MLHNDREVNVDFFATFLVMVYMVGTIAGLITLIFYFDKAKDRQRLDLSSRFQSVYFNNIVLDSRGNTPHTEIDEVIVSPYGIFCIEEKGHVGFIFGSERQKTWTQCKYSGRRPLPNPLHQNYKHVQALNDLLKGQLKAPIHSYVVFLSASRVDVESQYVFSSKESLMEAIAEHRRQIYSLQEYEEILRILVSASSRSKELLPVHIAEVNAYLKRQAAVNAF